MDWKTIKILAVDDSMTQLTQIKHTLEKKQATVITAKDGKEGLKKVLAEPVDIVITDIEMPEMNGYLLCSKIKENPKTTKIPVILLTNLSDPEDVIRGIECRADNFLTKPCSDHLLYSCIEDAIENTKFNRNGNDQKHLEFSYHGKRYKLLANNCQVTDLLLSTYSTALEKNTQLEETNKKLSTLHLELQKKSNQLATLIEQKNLMLGMAAHDLRNPLNAIQLYSEILQMKLADKIDQKISNTLKTIETSSKFMLQLVNDLLDISVIDAGEMRINAAEHDLSYLIERTASINEALAERKNIMIDCKTPNESVYAVFDSGKIEQVIHNLLNNAIKFSKEGNTIEITLDVKGDEAIVKVKDSGVGISKENQEKLFQTFSKATHKGTAGEPTTGLGLAIAKKIVEGHNGRIAVDSEPGLGAAFYFTLKLGKSGLEVSDKQKASV